MVTLLVCAAAPEARRRMGRCTIGLAEIDRVVSAASAADLLSALRGPAPELVLLDAPLQGLDPAVLRTALAGTPGTRLFVVGHPEDHATMAMAMTAGAQGFLRRDLSPALLAVALAHGRRRLVGQPAAEAVAPLRRVKLTARELQVLSGMAEGKSNGDIGRGLYLSEDTVKTHARRLYRKLGVNDRAHAVASGFRLGIVS